MKIRRKYKVIAIAVGVLAISLTAYAGYFSNRILSHTVVGGVALGGMTGDDAAVVLQDVVSTAQDAGVHVDVEGHVQTIESADIGFEVHIDQAIDTAFARGHDGSFGANLAQRVASLWQGTHVDAPVHVDEAALRAQLDKIALAVEVPRKDVRLSVSGGVARVLTDMAPGRIIDRRQAMALIGHALATLDSRPITLSLVDDAPVADPALAATALAQAKKMLSRGLSLKYEDFQFFISQTKIGSWITSEYDGSQLKAGLDRDAIAHYVTGIATTLNIGSVPPQITTQQGKVVGFTPARVGRSVQEDVLADQISAAITDRAGADKIGDTLIVPLKTTKLALVGLDASSGISELIGKATTPFTGSPKNRISNIKNGVKFLSGTVVKPGDEFSTLATLGAVDNTTGYLPELVIKGDRTTPEFGGGLCQVSTTLFRAVMNAGLPVTARVNHSYRVSYYEKDGDGTKIGPGLDATIFDPNPDFKFRNDSATPVLIIGYVFGDKITFELYGTKDGRTSAVDGPHLLTETPSGDPKYIETATLPAGVKKQVETPHAGGTAIATYSVKYADGRTAKQVFKSSYRPWPAQYLVGTNTGCTTSAQCAALFPELFATPFPTPVAAH